MFILLNVRIQKLVEFVLHNIKTLLRITYQLAFFLNIHQILSEGFNGNFCGHYSLRVDTVSQSTRIFYHGENIETL